MFSGPVLKSVKLALKIVYIPFHLLFKNNGVTFLDHRCGYVMRWLPDEYCIVCTVSLGSGGGKVCQSMHFSTCAFWEWTVYRTSVAGCHNSWIFYWNIAEKAPFQHFACKFTADYVDINGNLPLVSLTPAANLPLVSLAPVANFTPVSTALAVPVGKFTPGVVDTGGKFTASVVNSGGAPWLAH